MTQVKEFMLLFSYTPDLNRTPTQEELAEISQAWGSYIGNIAIQEKLVSTFQLGFEGAKVNSDRSVSDGIVMSENQTLSGNMVVKASSLEEATEIAKECPILHAGGSVEVRSTIPMN